ncbi:hypothetical protein M405DRAFT_822039 [Rhizopogon salebrosus TDB-379]|nr:hypothetical protein M405DRAFT_822039 [Rhizopogon salebrosus TDB-379]
MDQVALVRDKQSLYVAPRQERFGDRAQRIKNPTWWTRCILVICCVSRATTNTDIVN